MQNLTFIGQTVSVIGAPFIAPGEPSKASLSGASYSSSDTAVFTVSPDPATPSGAIITATGSGTATLSESALATEPDGKTTETISGTDTITVTVAAPPVATMIEFTYGTPSIAAPVSTGTRGIDAAHQ